MTFEEIKELFQEYAESHVAIQHSEENKGFVVTYQDEKAAAEAVVKCTSEVILVLLTHDQKMMPVKGENYNWDKPICFLLLKRCGRAATDDIVAAQEETQLIGEEFFAKLTEDRYSRIRSFQQESYYMEPTGPVFDEYFGHICLFTLIDEAMPATDPARWL